MASDAVSSNEDLQEAEIAQLREKYGAECKVIRHVGDFQNVVIARPKDVDVVVKFQLTGSYPTEKPSVIVRSDTIPVDCMPELHTMIDAITDQTPRVGTIDNVIQRVTHHLKSLGLDGKAEICQPKKATKNNSKKNHKQEKKAVQNAKQEEADKIDKKKPSMKTAEDVIKRIQWDENIQTEDFLVGYLDRFKGIMERSFNAFSWGDLASADYNVLAIPKHRIQYFKYKEVIVWDKNKRLDYIFGSVGRKSVSIHDVIENYESYKSAQAPDQYQVNHSGDEDDNEDDDDDIQINFSNRDAEQESEDNQRPTHFVCARITNPEILEAVGTVQEAIMESETRYASCCIPPAALHLTLCTVGLDTSDDLVTACQTLKNAEAELAEFIKTGELEVRVEGVDNFFDRVIYARVHHDLHFTKFVERLENILRENSVEIRNNHGYNPHVTIMKTSREVSREMKTSKVNKSLYDRFTDMFFGTQSVTELYLCEMSNIRRDDGFFWTYQTIKLNE